MIMVHPYQSDTNCKYGRMTCRACIQISLDVDGIDGIIYNQMLKTPHEILVHLADSDNGRKPDIVTLKRYRGDIF